MVVITRRTLGGFLLRITPLSSIKLFCRKVTFPWYSRVRNSRQAFEESCYDYSPYSDDISERVRYYSYQISYRKWLRGDFKKT